MQHFGMILWQQYAGIAGTGKRPKVGRLAEVRYRDRGGEHYLEGLWWKWRELIKTRAFNESLSCVKNASYSHNNPKVTLILTHVSTDFLTWKQWLRGVK